MRDVTLHTVRASCEMNVHEKMLACGRCICLHLPSIARRLKCPASEMTSLNKKNYCSVQDEVRQES